MLAYLGDPSEENEDRCRQVHDEALEQFDIGQASSSIAKSGGDQLVPGRSGQVVGTRVQDVTVGKRLLRVDFELFDEQMVCLDRLTAGLGPEDAAAVDGLWELLAECRACWADAMGKEGDAVVYGLEVSDV